MSKATKAQVDALNENVNQLGEYIDMRFDASDAAGDAGRDAATEAARARAAAETIEAANSIAEAARLLMAGNTTAGVGMLLNGLGGIAAAIGSLTSVLGPLAPIFSVLTGVIAAILKFFEPEPKSLAEQVEEIVGRNALDEVRKNLTADEAVWQIMTGGLDVDGRVAMLARTRQAITYAAATNTAFVFDEKTMAWPLGYDDEFRYNPDRSLLPAEKKLAAEATDLGVGMSWERIQRETHIDSHLQFMLAALEYLGGFEGDKTSKEWVDLGNATAAYTFRMWLYIHQFVGIVSPDSALEFARMRHNLVKALTVSHEKDDVGSSVSEFTADIQRNGTLYARWESIDKGTFEMNSEPFQRRDGVVGDVADFVDAGYRTTNFAVSSRGTAFGCSTTGRASAGVHPTWTESDDPPFGDNSPQDNCSEVFIGEPVFADQESKVVVAWRDGQPRNSRLALCEFDEAVGAGSDGPGQWTPNQGRWGPWKTWSFDFRIASVAFSRGSLSGYEIFILALYDDMRMVLHQLKWAGDTTLVEGFSWTPAEVKSAKGWNLVKGSYWPLSCAISLDPFTVQVGNSVRIKQPGGIAEWDLAKLMNSPNAKVHQARFYSDRTFLACSNLGLHQRRWDFAEYKWDHDLAVETTCVHKVPMAQAGTWVQLMAQCHAIQTARA